MNVLNLLRGTAALSCLFALTACGTPESRATGPTSAPTAQAVKFQQIRNATIKIDYAGTTFLIDPMLSAKGTWPGFPGTINDDLTNPLVDLPVPMSMSHNS